jgi:hypothetical protein
MATATGATGKTGISIDIDSIIERLLSVCPHTLSKEILLYFALFCLSPHPSSPFPFSPLLALLVSIFVFHLFYVPSAFVEFAA